MRNPNVIEGKMRLIIRDANGGCERLGYKHYRLEVVNGCIEVTSDQLRRNLRPETVVTTY
jgi:hypothetical protein